MIDEIFDSYFWFSKILLIQAFNRASRDEKINEFHSQFFWVQNVLIGASWVVEKILFSQIELHGRNYARECISVRQDSSATGDDERIKLHAHTLPASRETFAHTRTRFIAHLGPFNAKPVALYFNLNEPTLFETLRARARVCVRAGNIGEYKNI